MFIIIIRMVRCVSFLYRYTRIFFFNLKSSFSKKKELYSYRCCAEPFNNIITLLNCRYIIFFFLRQNPLFFKCNKLNFYYKYGDPVYYVYYTYNTYKHTHIYDICNIYIFIICIYSILVY